MKYAIKFFLMVTALFWVALGVGYGDMNPMSWSAMGDRHELGGILFMWMVCSLIVIVTGIAGKDDLDEML